MLLLSSGVDVALPVWAAVATVVAVRVFAVVFVAVVVIHVSVSFLCGRFGGTPGHNIFQETVAICVQASLIQNIGTTLL